MTDVKPARLSLWRAIALVLAFLALSFVFASVGAGLLEFIFGSQARDPEDVPFQWVALAAVAAATYAMLRLEKLPWSAVGLDLAAASPRLLMRGTVIGAVTIGATSLILVGIQQLRIVATPDGSWWGLAARSAAVLLPAAFFEELVIRGYVFAVLRRAAGWKIALIATSVVFGLLHVWNPGADAESILAVVVAGFFLGAIFLATKSLYAAGAAHFAWNWMMAGALHTPVSGLPLATPDYKTVDAGPDWLTGGVWGPEGGLGAVAAMFIVLFFLYGRHLRRMEF